MLWFWVCAFLALFIRLGTVTLTGAEEQTISVAKTMLASGDWLHVVLDGKSLLHVPFLHYWFVAALSALSGEGVTVFIARLPSVIAGIVMIICIISMTRRLFSEDASFITSWMLLTTVPFVRAARAAGADMMGVAFIFAAIAWYLKKRDGAGFLSYSFFFLLCACGALTNGFIIGVIPCIIVFIDLCVRKSWKEHFNFSALGGAFIGIAVCLIPFVLEFLSENEFKTEGIAAAWHRFFFCTFQYQAHKSIHEVHPVYLPGFMIPWTIILIPSFIYWISKFIRRVKGEKKAMNDNELFFIVSVFAVIVFSITRVLHSGCYTFIQIPFYAVVIGVFLSTVKEGKLHKFTLVVFNVMAVIVFIIGLIFISSPLTAVLLFRKFSPELLPFTKAEANIIMFILPLIGLKVTSFILLQKRKIKKGKYLFDALKHIPFCGVVIVCIFILTLCASHVFSFFRIFG